MNGENGCCILCVGNLGCEGDSTEYKQKCEFYCSIDCCLISKFMLKLLDLKEEVFGVRVLLNI